MSPATASASEPARSTSATQFPSASSFRAVTTTFAPRSPARRAIARPRPLEAPVTRTTCSESGFFGIASRYPKGKALRFVHAGDRDCWSRVDPRRRVAHLRAEAPPGDRALAREGHARVQGLDHGL